MRLKRQSDLFESVGQRPCARCGQLFEIDHGLQGRPVLFCSVACRTIQAKAQRRAWAKAQRDPAACRTCGAALPPHSGPGRLARYCSDECRITGITQRRLALRSSRLTR